MDSEAQFVERVLNYMVLKKKRKNNEEKDNNSMISNTGCDDDARQSGEEGEEGDKYIGELEYGEIEEEEEGEGEEDDDVETLIGVLERLEEMSKEREYLGLGRKTKEEEERRKGRKEGFS
ncbi:uncharacterized protein MONOS_3237 [Monocercomonoides exilis]|uniref:uncharacterized protein n=1 Tax=Monocercomonoides exilis TaxID=2049356 RepID=UPI00355A0308|nr:hypothetical protein MONOS_3237 [Monocercomonoides exilis]|eukprot:MONOS_3237.1-p1 / transcript=MONOS_3237.1 / gene=MONOS_3237 / organism=Monocercomonoides_exilis_PA203 / gene_product=unspecified product / transcript_product=unspecified product / location=Mono_scaffold00074:134283-134799(+) / protein_length=120 / sequence_SO=supercontig / SO=protein_coding / is_pseudo=false